MSTDADLDEAYSFSAYASIARPFVVDGEVRGSHWLEGPADGARVYVCDVVVQGSVPDLVVRSRSLTSLAVDTPLPRVRCGEAIVDGAVAFYTRAAELPRRLVAQAGVVGALLTDGLRVQLETGAQECRLVVERAVGADARSVGFLADVKRAPHTPPPIKRTPSRVAAATATAIGVSRELVRAFDEIARWDVTWSQVSLFEAGTLDEDALARLLEAVMTASSWLTGHAARVGNGVQARLSLPLGADELAGVLSVTPAEGSAVTVRFEGALPETQGNALRMSPEQGWRAKLRSLVELEVGSPQLDDALLIEGDRARLDEVRAAAVSLGELADHTPHIAIESARLVVELPKVPFDGHVTDPLEACLEAWEVLRGYRAGQR